MIRLQEGESIGLLMMHHAISDGWSTKVLFREFVTLYEAYASRSEPRLPPLSIQYSDYAAWQREQFDREAMNGQRAFWRERLRGAPALLDLPADYPRPSRQDFRGGRIGIAISPALTARVRELAKREGATLFMALMAAFKILLYRYSGQDDVVVGTPVAGRNRPELEPLIGCFLNMLAIRTRIDEAQNFPTFLQAVKTSALASFANQDVPFEKLLEDLDIERNLAYSPLYQTAFSFEENPLAQVRMRDLELTFEEVQTQTAKVDLALELTVAGEGLSGWFEYRADLFAPWRIERLAVADRASERAFSDAAGEHRRNPRGAHLGLESAGRRRARSPDRASKVGANGATTPSIEPFIGCSSNRSTARPNASP